MNKTLTRLEALKDLVQDAIEAERRAQGNAYGMP